MALENERVVYNPLMMGGGMPNGGDGLFGGAGGGGLIGGILLASLLGRNGGGLLGGGGPGDGVGAVTSSQNIADLRSELGALGNEVQAAFAAQTASETSQFINLSDLISSADKTATVAALNGTIQGLQNTQNIKDQASNFQVVNQENFCNIRAAINADGDATRALITTNLIEGLRSELAGERRGRDNREIEITVTQSNNQLQNQFQAQQQQQTQFFANALNILGEQINRQTNSLVNIGSGAVTAPQTNNNANTKVNS